jgi:plasmid stability protein
MTVTLKNIPNAVHQALKQRAKANNRSLNKEAITCLESALGVLPPDTKALHEEIIAFRQKLAKRGFKPMTQRQLKAAIEEGRE